MPPTRTLTFLQSERGRKRKAELGRCACRHTVIMQLQATNCSNKEQTGQIASAMPTLPSSQTNMLRVKPWAVLLARSCARSSCT